MRLLLDAHTLLWWLADDQGLAEAARDAIADPANDVMVSAATVWEIAVKRALGKLEAPPDVTGVLGDSGFVEVPVLGVDGERAGALPPHHRDPFDRMLVAQSLRLEAVIITRDPAFEAYGVRTLGA